MGWHRLSQLKTGAPMNLLSYSCETIGSVLAVMTLQTAVCSVGIGQDQINYLKQIWLCSSSFHDNAKNVR